MEKKTVCIIGGGASGLMAAIYAAKEGASVILLEHNEKPGRKLLATGNGRCNLTNIRQEPFCYRGTHPEFAWKVIQNFSMKETIAFFTDLGIYTKNRNGYLYPASGQASSVLEVLEMEARYKKVKIKCREHVVGLEKNPALEKWLVKTEGWVYEADCVILACGSAASDIPGSGTSGYELAEKLGHKIIEPLPALVPLVCKGNFLKQWAGVRTDGAVSLLADGEILSADRGELQLTDYGISGIPVFQISRYAVRMLNKKKHVQVRLDFMPDFSEKQLAAFLHSRHEKCPYKTIKEGLCGLFPKKLIDILTKNITDIPALAHRIKNMELEVKGPKSIQAAQVCSGGVSTDEINPETMESRFHSGLYFAGELTDIDGICGGYNLQWAWSSGALAGKNAGRKVCT